jgi:O-acetyl-ADP-ribose deacetylase (regulator of RNase III)
MSAAQQNWTERISVIQGDITQLAVDAIANAANSSLLGGGGVDGAIHAAAGRQLREECKTLGGCATGEAKITKGYNLPARHVIHTVGPIWYGGKAGEDELLARCYRNTLAVAERHGLRSVALPSISTGAFGFPVERACRIALAEIKAFLEQSSMMEKVTIVCFDRSTMECYRTAWSEVVQPPAG